jgi:phage/plasmid-associated DNA primase
MLCNSNYRWKIKDFLNKNDPEDDSVSRRALIINFDKTISVENRDTLLSQRLYKERAGIFQWLVRGMKRLRRDKYRISETFDGKMETALAQLHANTFSTAGKKISGSVSEYVKYKKCKDSFQDGLELLSVPVSKFYENYLEFCDLHNVPSVSISKFSIDLGYLGYEKFKDHTRNYSMSVKVYVDGDIRDNFLEHVPMIAEELTMNIFEGDDKYRE